MQSLNLTQKTITINSTLYMNNISLPLNYCQKVDHVGQCAMPPYSTIPVSNTVVKFSIY